MTQQEFMNSAVIISDEMCKFIQGKSCNFGFITTDSQNYRIFAGGFTDNIANGVAIAIAHICAQTGEGEEFINGIASSAIAIINEQKGVPLQ